jgi:hypothetical protein
MGNEQGLKPKKSSNVIITCGIIISDVEEMPIPKIALKYI